MSLTRLDVVQGLLDLYESPRYLEVGVHAGMTFLEACTAAKVAVDPAFRFDVEEARRAHPDSEFWPVESDEYFGRPAGAERCFDVVFLDGLHTFEQTLRDLGNALMLLHDDGVVVIDDVYPSSSGAAIADLDRFVAAHSALDLSPTIGWATSTALSSSSTVSYSS